MENLYLVLDESGFLHRNYNERYFVIGGYLTKNPGLITKMYKDVINLIKKNKEISLKQELKASDLSHKERKKVLKSMEENDSTYVFIVIDKNHVSRDKKKHINLFYNYAVMILIKSLHNQGKIPQEITNLHVLLDNRSIKIGDLNGLASYCNTKFHIECDISCNFKTHCQYVESHHHSGIQIADLLCNVMWCRYNYPQTDGSSVTLLSHDNHIVKFPYARFGR